MHLQEFPEADKLGASPGSSMLIWCRWTDVDWCLDEAVQKLCGLTGLGEASTLLTHLQGRAQFEPLANHSTPSRNLPETGCSFAKPVTRAERVKPCRKPSRSYKRWSNDLDCLSSFSTKSLYSTCNECLARKINPLNGQMRLTNMSLSKAY